tara:strand:- start:276 stop:380 length:105 start_codon:yes stop_codon:yes gene_type:complete
MLFDDLTTSLDNKIDDDRMNKGIDCFMGSSFFDV